MCGRRKLERDHPELCDWGDMDNATLQKCFEQIPNHSIVQLHNNGEPLLYLLLEMAIERFKAKGCFVSLNTNGKLLMDRLGAILDLDMLVVSVIENDPEAGEQLEILEQFDSYPCKTPPLVLRFLGDVDQSRYAEIPHTAVTRTLHRPEGSRGYRKQCPRPEIGVCLDLLTHLAIDRWGNVSMCVRFDPYGDLMLGNINHDTKLEEMIHGEKRKRYIEAHRQGKRQDLPGCQLCEYWGCPNG